VQIVFIDRRSVRSRRIIAVCHCPFEHAVEVAVDVAHEITDRIGGRGAVGRFDVQEGDDGRVDAGLRHLEYTADTARLIGDEARAEHVALGIDHDIAA
jgi:hypothetical protein